MAISSQGSAPDNHAWLRPLALALLLLVIAAARILRFDSIFLGKDEIWSIWQGSGSLAELLRWNPYDWPPLYYIVLKIWVELLGFHPLALRAVSTLTFLLGMVFFYRVVSRGAGEMAATISTLIYGGMSYTIFLSTELRGYALLQLAIPLSWYFAQGIIYDKPKIKNALGFALVSAATLYTAYIALPFVIWMMLYLMVMHLIREKTFFAGKRLLLLTLLLSLVLMIPLVIYIWPLAAVHFAHGTYRWSLPSLSAFAEMYQVWFGYGTWIILALIVLGLLRMLWRQKWCQHFSFLVLLGFVIPVVLFFLDPLLGMFQAKYASWALFGIAGSLGFALSRYSKLGQRVAIVSGLVLLLLPIDWQEYNGSLTTQLDKNLAWLQNEWRAGDVLLLADDRGCSRHTEVWNQTLRTYFSAGLPVIDSIEDEARIWYVNYGDAPDSPHWRTLQHDYVERQFVGPPECQFRLFEGPPDREGILFDNGLRFHGAQMLEEGEVLAAGYLPLLHEGETMKIRLWWSVAEPLPQDYSIALFLMDEEDYVFDENLGPPYPTYPADVPWETSRWQQGQYYIEERELSAPFPNTTHRAGLAIRLAVYHWQEPANRFAAIGTDSLGMLTLFKIEVVAW